MPTFYEVEDMPAQPGPEEFEAKVEVGAEAVMVTLPRQLVKALALVVRDGYAVADGEAKQLQRDLSSALFALGMASFEGATDDEPYMTGWGWPR